MRPRSQGRVTLLVALLLARPLAGQSPPASDARAATIAGYCAAWGERERGTRDSLLREVWAADGRYSDPATVSVEGRRALGAHIEGFLRQNAGVRFRCSAPQGHHQTARFTWTIVGASGAPVMSGMDFAEFGTDGRLRRIVGFFGDLPVAPDPEGPASATLVTGADVARVLEQMPSGAVSDQQIRMVIAGPSQVGVGAVSRPEAATQTGIAHDKLTEVYYVLEGAGTLVTGGVLVNARPLAAASAIYRELTGPSVTGSAILGGERRRIAAGDVVIIPAGVPHWFSAIEGRIKYLVVRVDSDRLLALK